MIESNHIWIGHLKGRPFRPVYARLRIWFNDEPAWIWRASMLDHNKRRRPGSRKLSMRGRSKRQ